ncbi:MULTISPECIES: PepSY-associated TM helix domain-containing protein [unclassified Lentimicrobium]|uniref:PepSY-associated TM helix domain-containing protein n=1 Tax=unclassified Lentimicrobium TaxID=2677434 RepID=UPI001551918B|nr:MULTISPECIES: PepSY-associated TM helix domain-containing protein [unclassified Lentimicrobium]NPD47813.1 hypothetical protein [Lentimicrobium sp. S6]NPD86069.1 hypothetical protein [Lentimicrobium sp. L6]
MFKFFKKYHKWLGLIFALFLIIYSLSGIVLNHRDLLSGVDVSRKLMPKSYTYKNWNLGALRGSEQIGTDSILLYGNMGLWLANGDLNNLRSFAEGLPEGMDNRKVFKIYKSHKGNLYLASLRGAYSWNNGVKEWKKIPIEIEDERFVDITERNGEIIFLSRSFLFKGIDNPEQLKFEKIQLQNPAGYDNKIGLFKTLWFIHSGEIYGHWGKLLVDLLGVVFILLSLGGVIYFFMPRRIKKKHQQGESIEQLKGFHKWNIRWHNKLGYWFIFFLLITTITGIFLRPPGLIFIASSKVGKIPYTSLATSNAWFDKLRAIDYNEERGVYILLTDERAFELDKEMELAPMAFEFQVPISIMGVTVFERISTDTYLVGSFAGLFEWNPRRGILNDFQHQRPYVPVQTMGPPIENSSISGWVVNTQGEAFYTDYDFGIKGINPEWQTPEMPQIIKESPISLWNLALEIHTARYFSFIFGIGYILIVPIVGFATIFILISGLVVWWKKYKGS